MVKIICLSLCMLFSIAPLTAEAAGFKLTTKETTVQLGKALWLDLQTDQATPSLDSIDFAPVAEQFEVVKDKNAIQRSKQGQQWRIRLYPRTEGQHSIAALHYQTHASTPIRVDVTPAIDLKTGQAFSIEHKVSTTQAWLRQQVLFTYELITPATSLVLAPQEATPADMLVMPLTTETKREQDKHNHRSGWALYPRQPGQHRIRLPALHYIQDGVITHRFFPPSITLDVKPLPAYLPGNLPVGKLSLRINDVPTLLLKNRLSEVRLQLHGEGIPLQWLPDLRPLFRGALGMTLYPAELSTQQTGHGGIDSQHDYRLPVKTTAQGRLVLPDVKLHYFDPTTGRLAQLSLSSQPVTSLSLWLVILLVLCTVTAIAWALTKAYVWYLPRWRCFKTYRKALKTLPDLKTAQDFRELIRQLSEAEGWSGNLSLRQWMSKLPVHTASQAQVISQLLEVALYRGVVFNVNVVREKTRDICITRWGVLRWK